MPESPIDLTKLAGPWLFRRLGSGDTDVLPAEGKVRQGILTMVVSTEDGALISLAIRAQGDALRSKAAIAGPPAVDVDVVVTIVEGGSHMKVTLPGHADMEEWDFSRPG